MVVLVKLPGLNVRRSRGKWYVSHRSTGASLIKGFAGTRSELDCRLAEPDVLAAYAAIANRDKRKRYNEGTLGHLVRWFKNECPRWDNLSPASRADYEKTFLYLEREFDAPLADITQVAVYEVRNKAAKARWRRFADKMVSHLSTIFSEALKVGRAHHNPAAGVEPLHKSDPNANHEWFPGEVAEAFSRVPRWLLTPMVLARYQGFRGQTCQSLLWNSLIPDARTGKAFSVVLRKNAEPAWFPCEPETIAHLDGLERTSTSICTTSEGRPWKHEKTMQGAASVFLTGLKREGVIRRGCTLHGLRVTYAAAMKRLGLGDGVVADALGDRSKRMGAHYTRHVEKEVSRLLAFERKNGVQTA